MRPAAFEEYSIALFINITRSNWYIEVGRKQMFKFLVSCSGCDFSMFIEFELFQKYFKPIVQPTNVPIFEEITCH